MWSTVNEVHKEPQVSTEVHRGPFRVQSHRGTQRFPGVHRVPLRCIEVHRNPQRSTDVHRGVLGSSLPQRRGQGGGTEIHKQPTEVHRGTLRSTVVNRGPLRLPEVH